jgi:hypothetical protein
MKNERLQATLQQLNEELAQAEGVDPETLEQLRELTANMQRVLDERGAAGRDEIESDAGGLRDLLLRFESEHPQLAVAIGKVADALAAMGI